MHEDFIVSGEYQGYTYVGHAEGRFETQDRNGENIMKDYYSMYVVSPVSSYTSADYAADGFKAEKKKCLSSSVWKGLKPGDRVLLYFDDKKNVIMAKLADDQ